MGLAAQALDPALRLQHALDLAFRYLGRRDRTVLEVRRYLDEISAQWDSALERLRALVEK